MMISKENPDEVDAKITTMHRPWMHGYHDRDTAGRIVTGAL